MEWVNKGDGEVKGGVEDGRLSLTKIKGHINVVASVQNSYMWNS